MREIKFRGKDYRGIKDTDYANFWQRGDLQTCRDGTVAIGDHPESAGYGNLRGRVIPETVGQYTGLKDKHGVEIYEGDVVKRGHMTGRVTYILQEAGFVVVTKNRDYRLGHRNTGECYAAANDHEVVGNIHDNPELLEEEDFEEDDEQEPEDDYQNDLPHVERILIETAQGDTFIFELHLDLDAGGYIIKANGGAKFAIRLSDRLHLWGGGDDIEKKYFIEDVDLHELLQEEEADANQ